MEFALMFDVLDGGVSEPIDWGKDALKPDRSIIILVESEMSLYLWHGKQRGLVQRRTALRQAQSLKGHGFTVGKSIIGRDIKQIKEIDDRKVGRVPDETELMEELNKILDRAFRVVEEQLVTFDTSGEVAKPKATAKASPKKESIPAPKVEAKPKTEPKPQAEPKSTLAPKAKPAPQKEPTTKVQYASEYDNDAGKIEKKVEKPKVSPAAKKETDLVADARVGFVLKAIMDHYDDIWVSKKNDGSYGVEMMDGPICQFSIKEGGSLSFTKNSFTGISTDVKSAIQGKFAELAKLL